MIDFLINRLKKFKAELNGNSTEDFAANALTSSSLVVNSSDLIAGYISGNLKFNSPATPPTISAGIRNVVGIPVQETADVPLATTDAFSLCSQTFGDYLDTWMKVLVNSSGVYKYIPSFDTLAVGSLTDAAVTSISVTSGTATVTTTGSTSPLANGHMVYVPVDSQGTIIGKAFNVAGNSFDVKTTLGNGSYASTTGYSARYRIATSHGTGTLTGVNTDPGIVGIYSPSPEFNPVYNGYYRDTNGAIDITATGVWRDLGAFYIDASGNVTDIISYKSGIDTNDHIIKKSSSIVTTVSSDNTHQFSIPGDFDKLWGNRLIVTSDGTNGTKFNMTTGQGIVRGDANMRLTINPSIQGTVESSWYNTAGFLKSGRNSRSGAENVSLITDFDPKVETFLYNGDYLKLNRVTNGSSNNGILGIELTLEIK